jgi:hypothetical protein
MVDTGQYLGNFTVRATDKINVDHNGLPIRLLAAIQKTSNLLSRS